MILVRLKIVTADGRRIRHTGPFNSTLAACCVILGSYPNVRRITAQFAGHCKHGERALT